jgi:hypothetical protein
MVVTASVAWGADEPSEMKVFALTESLDAQMQRLKQLQTASPATANRIMQRGQLLVSLAKAGNLKQLDSAVTSTAPWEIVHWHSMQSFRAATLAGHLSVVRIFPAAPVQSASYLLHMATYTIVLLSTIETSIIVTLYLLANTLAISLYATFASADALHD